MTREEQDLNFIVRTDIITFKNGKWTSSLFESESEYEDYELTIENKDGEIIKKRNLKLLKP